METYFYRIIIDNAIWYLKWWVELETEEDEEFKDEIKQEVAICIQEQYGGHKVY